MTRERALPELGRHIPALDGIRGLAIILVMLTHFTFFGGMQPEILVDRIFYDVATLGWWGVDLFFVLSGFLITGILLDTRESSVYFRSFYMRRVLRIFPLYYAFLVAFFVVLPHVVWVDENLGRLMEEQGWFWSYLVNWRIAFEGWPPHGAIGHFWSLAIEEQFYLFWPLVVYLCRRPTLKVVCLAIVGGSLVLRSGLLLTDLPPVSAYVLTPARMDTLAIGGLLALVARERDGMALLARWSGRVTAASAVGLAAIFIATGSFRSIDPAVATLGYTFLATLCGGALGMTVASSGRGLVGRFFAHPALTFFGRYSYALYVFHHPVIVFMRRKGFRVDKFPTLMDSQLFGQTLVIIEALGITLLLALLSWYLLESPFLKLKAWFPYHARKRPRTVRPVGVQSSRSV